MCMREGTSVFHSPSHFLVPLHYQHRAQVEGYSVAQHAPDMLVAGIARRTPKEISKSACKGPL